MAGTTSAFLVLRGPFWYWSGTASGTAQARGLCRSCAGSWNSMRGTERARRVIDRRTFVRSAGLAIPAFALLPAPLARASGRRGTRNRAGPAALAAGPRADEAPYRLPRTVVPDRYDLIIRPDLAAAPFAGEETIAVRVLEPVDEVVL